MDRYTLKTKEWLDNRFRQCDSDGIYFAHQPIYGFRSGHSESGFIERYIRTYQIMKTLAQLKFDTLLDVGGAEGFKAHIAQRLFEVTVRNSDLSKEACNRAQEIFTIESTPADIHDLPFADDEFDVTLCSETLEHVSDFHRAVNEILRVTRLGAIITVPHEPVETINSNIKEETPHAHIHHFDLKSLNFLSSQNGYHITSQKMIHPLIRIPAALIEAMPVSDKVAKRYPKTIIDFYNVALPICRMLFGKRAAATIIRLDELLCRLSNSYTAILFIILKNKLFIRANRGKKISLLRIINTSVPLYKFSSGLPKEPVKSHTTGYHSH